MSRLLTQDPQLAKNYGGESILYPNQVGCNRLFSDVITLMFIKKHQLKKNRVVRSWIMLKAAVLNCSVEKLFQTFLETFKENI